MRGTYHIEAPVKTVYEFFFDPRKGADLFPGTEIRELKMTKEGTGTYTSYHMKMAGIPFNTFSVYTEVVPNKHITEKSSNALVGTWDYSFESEGKGTKVTMEHHSRSIWGVAPLSTVGDLVTTRMNASFMQRVKDRLEAAAAAA
jgi:uncharacterized protein YndB with AHSA1/START domain